MYTVSSTIIVREGTENAAAEFLYKSNPLVNPYRNFYNELYIMRSYPLLQQVVEQLNFQVGWYRVGNVKTTEVYERNFPFNLRLIRTTGQPAGRNLGFTAKSNEAYELQYIQPNGDPDGPPKQFAFGDTVQFNGFSLVAFNRGNGNNLNKQFSVKFHDAFGLAQQYSGRLKATWAEPGSSVIKLEIRSGLPAKEIDFINKFIERYQQYDIEKKNLVASKSIEFLDKQIRNIGDSLQYFDNKIELFRQNNATSNFEGVSEQILQRLQEIEGQLSQLTLYSNYFDYLQTYLSKSQSLDQVVPPSAVGLSDPVVTELITKLMEVQFSMRMLGGFQTEENPLVAEQRKRINQLKTDILEGVKSIRAAQKINRDFLEKQLRQEELKLAKLPISERELLNINRNYTIRENMYTFLLQKRAEAGISRASTTSDIVVVNPPTQSGGFITPTPVQNYAIAVMAGLLLPFAFFLLAEVLNNKVQAKEDIEHLTAIPLIGAVGHNPNSTSNLAVFFRPRSSLAESFRALRSNLNYFTESKEKKIILITSSVSGEGKTFTAINLATTMAFTGKPVLIIGADMRKPKIFGDFKLPNTIGLSTFLSGMSELMPSIQKTEVPGLDLLSSGPVPPNPGELLLLPKVAAMFPKLLEVYDYILIDTPPLGLVSDAFALMPYASHTIFMIRQNYTPRYYLRDLQELFEKRELINLSILFNDIQKTGPGYGYGHGYGYGYGIGYADGKTKKGGGYYED